MSWTYDPTDLSTDLPKVRLIIGDTNTADQQLQDEEITYFIGVEGSLYGSAAACCEALATKYARQADKQVGQLRLTWKAVSDRYQSLADRLRRRASNAIPSAGGLDQSQKDSYAQDTNLPQPFFRRGLMDFPGATTPTGVQEDDELP